MWNFDCPGFSSFESVFLQRFRAFFDLPEEGDGAGEQIITLKQGRNTAAEFALCESVCSSGQAGHVKISCPTRPKQHASSAVSQSFNSSKCVKMLVKLAFNDGVIEKMALIDSDAAGNFIDADFAKSHDLSLIPCKSPLAALDRRPLGAGQV